MSCRNSREYILTAVSDSSGTVKYKDFLDFAAQVTEYFDEI